MLADNQPAPTTTPGGAEAVAGATSSSTPTPPPQPTDTSTPPPSTTTLGGAEAMQGGAQGASDPRDLFATNAASPAADPRDLFANQGAPQPQQTTAPASSGDPNSPGWFVDGVEAFNRQFSKMSLGAMDLAAAPFVAAGSTTAQDFRNKIANVNTQETQSLAQAQQRSPIATDVGTGVGALGSSLAYGGAEGIGGGLLASMGKTALIGAAQGATGYAPTMGDRLDNAMVSGGSAAATVGALGLLGTVASKLNLFADGGTGSNVVQRVLTPATAVKNDVGYLAAAQGSNPTGAVDAANRLGIDLSPSQAMGGDELRGLEGGISGNVTNKGAISDFQTAQQGQLGGLINNTISNFTPAGKEATQQAVNDIYAGFKATDIDPAAAAQLEANPVIKQQLDILSDPSQSTVPSLPSTNMYVLDQAKKNIDDQLFKDTIGMTDPDKNGLTDQTRSMLMDARNQISDTLSQYGDYAQGNQLAQAQIIRSRYDNLFDKKNGPAGTIDGATDVTTPDAMHQVLFGNRQKMNYFLNDVATTGGNVDQVKDIMKVSQQMYQSALQAPSESAVVTQGGSLNILGIVRDIGLSRYEKALVDMSLGGNKWAPQIAAIANAGSKEAQQQTLLQTISQVAKSPGSTAAGMLSTNNNSAPSSSATSLATAAAPPSPPGGQFQPPPSSPQ